MKKKVAFITPIYLPAHLNGSGVVVRELAELLVKSNFDVTVITSNALTPRYWYDPFKGKKITQKTEVINDVKIIRLPCQPVISTLIFYLTMLSQKIGLVNLTERMRFISSGPYLTGLKKIFEKEQFDVIHVSPLPYYINKQVKDALLDNMKFIITPFSHFEFEEYKNKAFKLIYDRADMIHAVSKTEKNQLIKYFDIPSKKIKVLNLFLPQQNSNTKKSHTMETINDLIKNYHLKSKKIILFAGVKNRNKGIFYLLKATEQLFEKDESILLITIGPSTKEWEAAKNTIKFPYLLDLGIVTEVYKEALFTICDVFCMPSRTESFGLVYLEAWSKGKPVVGANISVTKEIIGNGGITVPYGKVFDLKNALENILENKKKAKVMGMNGNKRLHKEFLLNSLKKSYVNLYQ